MSNLSNFRRSMRTVSTPFVRSTKQSRVQKLVQLVLKRDAAIRAKDDLIKRLTNAITCSENYSNLRDALLRCQQLEKVLQERDQMCQALKRRVVALDAKVVDLAFSGREKIYRCDRRMNELSVLRETVRRQQEELRDKDERLSQYANEMQEMVSRLESLDSVAQSRMRTLVDRERMCHHLMERNLYLESNRCEMVMRCDYEAVRMEKRKLEQENATLRQELKRQRLENRRQ